MRRNVVEVDPITSNPGCMLLLRGMKDGTPCLSSSQNVWRAPEQTSSSWKDGWTGDAVIDADENAWLVEGNTESGVRLHVETGAKMLCRNFDIGSAFADGKDCVFLRFCLDMPKTGFDFVPQFPEDTVFALFFVNETAYSGEYAIHSDVRTHMLYAYVYDPKKEEPVITQLTVPAGGYGGILRDNYDQIKGDNYPVSFTLRIYKNIMAVGQAPRMGFICQMNDYDIVLHPDWESCAYAISRTAYGKNWLWLSDGVDYSSYGEYKGKIKGLVNKDLYAYNEDIILVSPADFVPDVLSARLCGDANVKALEYHTDVPAWMPEEEGEAKLILDGVKISVSSASVAFDGVIPTDGTEISESCVMSARGDGTQSSNKFSFKMAGTDLEARPILKKEMVTENGYECSNVGHYLGAVLEDGSDGLTTYELASGANLHLYAVAAAATVTDSDGNVSYVEDLSGHIERDVFNSGAVVKVLLDSEVAVCNSCLEKGETVFDLNGCTVGLFNDSERDSIGNALFLVDQNASEGILTIRDSSEEQDGRLVARDTLSYGIFLYDDGAGNRKLEIEGGIFDARIGVYTEEYEVVQFTGVLEGVTVVLTGGSFNKALFSTEGDEPTFTLAGCVADGYKYELKDGYYVVTKAA